MIGDGIGALIVRKLTLGNIENIRKYPLIKHGAMYSILALSILMLFDSGGKEIPMWLAPIATFPIVGYFLYKSIKLNRKNAKTA